MSISVTTHVTDESRTDVTDVNGVVRQETRNFDVSLFAPDAPGDYPVVFWSSGHFSNPASASGATNPQALADQGFIVLVATHLDSVANAWQSLVSDKFPLEFTGATTHRVARSANSRRRTSAFRPSGAHIRCRDLAAQPGEMI
jgi:hypothetical protein